MTDRTGYLFELFCSVQGEGVYVGERQIFVRTSGCAATCYWCDTPSSKKKRPVCRIHAARKRSLENPVSVEDAVREVLALKSEYDPVRTVSLTGGEPLEQPEFTGGLAAALKKKGFRVYLETNGLEPRALAEVLKSVDVVSMDFKLPSATGTVHWDVHREFLRAARRVEVFVKVVVDHSTPLDELDAAVRLVAEVDAGVPLVLQPESATFLGGAHGEAARQRLQDLLDRAQRRGLTQLRDVRVIPQCHKLLKVR